MFRKIEILTIKTRFMCIYVYIYTIYIYIRIYILYIYTRIYIYHCNELIEETARPMKGDFWHVGVFWLWLQ